MTQQTCDICNTTDEESIIYPTDLKFRLQEGIEHICTNCVEKHLTYEIFQLRNGITIVNYINSIVF